MRDVIVEDRSWTIEDEDSPISREHDRRESTDPVTAAGVDYGYARI